MQTIRLGLENKTIVPFCLIFTM